MAQIGVAVVVLKDDTVLLTRREDFEVWCLPGGAVDPHEAVDQAAIREVFEETGLQVELTHFVGLLSKPFWGRQGVHLAVFAARPLTLTLHADPAEVGAVDFFPVGALPEPLLEDHGRLIAAARAGATGHLWLNRSQTPPRFADRAELYAWRDQSGLSRAAAYQQLMQEIGAQATEVVLGPTQENEGQG
jgi:8-oxo-dGTP diphosphatase